MTKSVEFENKEDGIKATVSPVPRGWAVCLLDTDSGEQLPNVRIYPPARKAEAVDLAKKWAGVERATDTTLDNPQTYDEAIAETLYRFRQMERESLEGPEEVIYASRVGTLYIMRAGETDLYKIGITSVGVQERRRQLHAGCPYPLTVIADFDVKDAKRLETKVHTALYHCRGEGEWFKLSRKELRHTQDVLIPGLLEKST